MSKVRFTRKALQWGAFFVGVLLASTAAGALCGSDRFDEQVRVRFVHDGDTLTLSDGRKLRLIGFNAPEMGRDGGPNEPLAIEARDFLRRMLFTQDQQLRLRLGREHQDRYGRLLAHAFLPDGRSVTVEMLKAGYGFSLVVPPNLWNLDCYASQESAARGATLGIWAEPRHLPKASTDLTLRTRGYHLVEGRVGRIGRGGDAVWLNLEGRVAVRIPSDSLVHFPDGVEGYLGRRIEVRGWFQSRKGELRVTVRHPAALRVLGDAPGERRER